MDLFLTVLKWAGVGAGGLVALVFLLACVLVAVDAARARRRRPAPDPAPPPVVAWTLSLLVEVDPAARMVLPTVQVRGGYPGDRSAVRLDVVDLGGVTRLQVGRDFPADAVGTELPLPTFRPPPDVVIDEMLGWTWRVTLEDDGSQVARWLEHPRMAGALSTEAEILEEV